MAKPTLVVYDFIELPKSEDIRWIDGSDELLGDADRVTAADRDSGEAGRLAFRLRRSPRKMRDLGPKTP